MSSKKVKTRSEASSSNSGRGGGESVVADCGRRRSSCGYCQSSARSSVSHGLWAESLTVDDYQALLDQGWRRSGCFLYKPEMDKTCCPSYTIRLKASDFVPSKEQQRVSRRMERFLDSKLDVKKPQDQTDDRGTSFLREVSDSVGKKFVTAKNEERNKVEPIVNDLSEHIDNAVQRCIQSGEFPSNIQRPKALVKKVLGAKRKQLAEGSEELLYTSNIAFQVAAALKCKQTAENGERNSAEENGLSPQSISEKLARAMNELAETLGLTVKACKGHVNFLSAAKDSSDGDVSIRAFSEGTNLVSEGESLCITESSERPQVKKRKLEVHLKRSSFDPEEHALYERYQLKVHNDRPEHVTESSYRRFLVDTPLIYVPPSGDDKVPSCGFGSFHQQYRLDGHLIAVGVVDILPKCLSSKYLFWDPDYAFLSLGKYSALREIDWVKENQVYCPSLQYYYLGYYIHSCSKMRYKAAYRPSELLCPLHYQWVPFEIARPLLDKKPYVVLSDFVNKSRNQDSLPPHDPETLTESTNVHEDMEPGDTNNCLLDYDDDEEMDEAESEDSDDESDTGNNSLSSAAEDHDITNILIGLGESRLRYKDIKPVMNPLGRKQLDSLLHRYRKVVGAELSERMVYDLR